MEEDLRWFVEPPRLDLTDSVLVWLCEQTIRDYDLCISCATHPRPYGDAASETRGHWYMGNPFNVTTAQGWRSSDISVGFRSVAC